MQYQETLDFQKIGKDDDFTNPIFNNLLQQYHNFLNYGNTDHLNTTIILLMHKSNGNIIVLSEHEFNFAIIDMHTKNIVNECYNILKFQNKHQLSLFINILKYGSYL